MQVRELIELLQRFPGNARVQLGVTLPGGFLETFERLWVADYGGGPQINAPLSFAGFRIYAGCSVQQLVENLPKAPSQAVASPHAAPQRVDCQAPEHPEIDLGAYASEEEAARVRDFYIIHMRLSEPLTFPEFDYSRWIPPRTIGGQYNPHIARILKKKLMEE